jgi:hypothetical protein
MGCAAKTRTNRDKRDRGEEMKRQTGEEVKD